MSDEPSRRHTRQLEDITSDVNNRRRGPTVSALDLGARKKPLSTSVFIHHGRHFGRTVYAMCNMNALVTNGLLHITDEEMSSVPDEELSMVDRREKRIFCELLKMVPGLEAEIARSSDEDIRIISDQLQKGVSGARSDDTKSIKGAVLDWITPRGVALDPPIARNSKAERGFNHEVTGALLCPANLDWADKEIKAKLRNAEFIIPGDQWPIFLYKDYQYDASDPWNGLLRSELLVQASIAMPSRRFDGHILDALQAYKHIFTSPSSVDKDPKATRSGNARIHGMTKVTCASLAYVATQLRFALSSSSVFSRTDMITDSQRFYHSIVDFLEEPEEAREVSELLKFWNRRIFPEHSAARRLVTKDSVLAKLKERRALMRQQRRS